MATKIVTKNSSTASAVPTASDLVQGELAVNVADKRLFTENNAGAIVELGTNPSALTVTGEITANGGIALGDNDKATFGAGDDLQIYHDGEHSYVSDTGIGYLKLKGSNYVQIMDASNAVMANFESGGAVYLSHNGADRFSTTATGIDVTGTATMDGLTVDGDAVIASAVPRLILSETDVTNGNWDFRGSFGNLTIRSLNDDLSTAAPKMLIGANGDIAFYEDTGTTPKFYWDASAESLGIGTSSPSYPFHLSGSGDTVAAVTAGASSIAALNLGNSTNLADGGIRYDNSANALILRASNTERMRIDSAGSTIIKSGNKLILNRTDNAIGGEMSYVAGTGFIFNDANGDGVSFNQGASNKVRISSAGHTTFGTTDDAPGAGNTVAGVAIRGGSDNRTFFSASSNYVAAFNRNTNDGSIVEFNKDGTTVGSIGTEGGRLQIGKGASGIYFYDSGPSVLPWNIGSNTGANNSIDLGSSGTRFKDLYLSGATKLFSGTNSPAANSTLGDVDFGARTDGTVTARVRGIAGSNGNGTDGQLTFYTASNTASQVAQERMRIDSAGNLLVGGTAYPNGTDTNWGVNAGGVQASSRTTTATAIHYTLYNSNGAVGSISTNGSATSFNTSSDQRLKENITDADDAGSKIDAIQVRQYDWKVDGSHQDYGMIAQELQAVAPEAVSGDADSEDMMGVDYSKLVPMLVKEIQSLRNRVAQLEE